MPRLLLLNGSVRGAAGNTARLLALARTAIGTRATLEEVVLADYRGSVQSLVDMVTGADGLLLGTGVYWSNHGSPVQRFLEVMTAWEATPVFVGKPAAALVTMDSVGGSDVAARLLGALNLLGCTVPPFGAVVLSRLADATGELVNQQDVWQRDDVALLADNLLRAAAERHTAWGTWAVRTTPKLSGTYPAPGTVHVDHEAWF